VNWQFERYAAEEAVHHQRGVRGLSNEIVVKPLAEKLAVADKIESALERNGRLEAADIKVDARGNQIVLHGIVHSFAAREEAGRAAWSSPGVSGGGKQVEGPVRQIGNES
jgi:osmotically-inducible protein OsmY